jgi:hypothetical protein
MHIDENKKLFDDMDVEMKRKMDSGPMQPNHYPICCTLKMNQQMNLMVSSLMWIMLTDMMNIIRRD